MPADSNRRSIVPDKRTSEVAAVSHLESGMTVGIGGWGSRRKPMSIVRQILRSDVTDLHVVSYGGPDVGLLCAASKVSKVTSGFVTLDSIPLEPHYRAARQNASIEAVELDEGMMMLGLMAAAWRLPFLPTRSGLGSDIEKVLPHLQRVRSPYPIVHNGEETYEELLAVPALELDIAFLHMNLADQAGNCAYLGPDLYMDDHMAAAATKCFVSTERIVSTEQLREMAPLANMRISRLQVDGVIETPGGAHFTECPPDYDRDEAFQAMYSKAAATAEDWQAFEDRFLRCPSESEYRSALDQWRRETTTAGGAS